jgi:hypothetical protein
MMPLPRVGGTVRRTQPSYGRICQNQREKIQGQVGFEENRTKLFLETERLCQRHDDPASELCTARERRGKYRWC